MFENNLWTMEPVGRPENTIQGDKYRFTLLTPCLIRMEYREDGKFEDGRLPCGKERGRLRAFYQ